jgi:hypothetical protein
VGDLDGLAEREVARQDDVFSAERNDHGALHGPGADPRNCGELCHELVVWQAAQDVRRPARASTKANHDKGGGMSARALPMPINPALLQHAEERRKSLENRARGNDQECWQSAMGSTTLPR